MKLGFVLSSGGPMAISHLGVLKKLEEEGIKPDVIAGSSAGAIIGGLYASGMPIDEMIELSLQGTVSEMFSDYTLFGLHKEGFGAIKGEKLLKLLREKTRNKSFHQLKIPTGFNAVNALTGKEVVLKKGGIAEAMRASSSIPILFKPFLFNGKYLIDGSVSNPLPSQIAKNMGADHIIGITFKKEEMGKINLDSELSIKDLKRLALSKLDDNALGMLKKLLSFPLIDKALGLLRLDKNMIRHFFRMHNANFKRREADTIIETDLKNASKTEDIIKKGYEQTAAIIDQIKGKIETKLLEKG